MCAPVPVLVGVRCLGRVTFGPGRVGGGVEQPAPVRLPRPLVVAGVAGGVGTSTVVRLLRSAGVPAHDAGRFRPGLAVEVLVTSVHATATAAMQHVLRYFRIPPVLVVSYTIPRAWAPSVSSARVRAAEAHVSGPVVVSHVRSWCGLDAAPGDGVLPKAVRDVPREVVSAVWPLVTFPPVPTRLPAAHGGTPAGPGTVWPGGGA